MEGDVHTETTYAVILNEDEARAMSTLAGYIQEHDINPAIERAGKLSTDEGKLIAETVVRIVKMARDLLKTYPPSGPERIQDESSR